MYRIQNEIVEGIMNHLKLMIGFYKLVQAIFKGGDRNRK